ncbi:MAG TPA: NAD(+)/NADH kinase, partial [Gemmatimonadales bacterium]|nr:NAD(+)/NADH kinase [Gemmatimonadales bacterium]
HLAQIAPRLGLTLYTEDGIAPLWPEPAPARLASAPQLDCLVTLGGDGTLLRGARTLNGAGTPILGVNLGRVGFLTTASAQTLDWALDVLVRRAYATESRLALAPFIVDKQGKSRAEPVVLNDAVVHKGGVARVIRLRVSVDGDEVGQYSADGIVIATPTGSTAYALSAGGPIVVPGVDAIVVAAICPHTLAVRPLVLPSQVSVTVEPIPPWTEEVLVSFDGQVGTTIQAGERLVVKRAEQPVSLVRLGPEGFFARMRKKLQWGDLSDRERK